MQTVSRKKLSEVVLRSGTSGFRRWYTTKLFEKYVRALLPSELEILEPPPTKKQNYNCFLYALGLHSSKKILKESKGFIYSAFIERLLDEGCLKETRRPKSGDIVLYRNPRESGQEFTHAGIRDRQGLIISKWSWGPLIKHRIFDVPSFYGSKTMFIGSLTKAEAERLWDKYRSFNRKNG